jgi:hypothetical protein
MAYDAACTVCQVTKCCVTFHRHERQTDNHPSHYNAFLDYLPNLRMRGIFGELFNDAIIIEENIALNDRESMSYDFEMANKDVFLA